MDKASIIQIMCQDPDNPIKRIEYELQLTIQALAVNSESQIASLSPGCITCELYHDFHAYAQTYLALSQQALTKEQRLQIEALSDILEAVPPDDMVCFDNDALARESWQGVRLVARTTLEIMGWPLKTPPNFTESSPGVWRRDQITKIISNKTVSPKGSD